MDNSGRCANVNMKQVKLNYNLRQNDVYVCSAVERLIESTVAGGIELKIGNIVPISTFSTEVEKHWVDHSKTALEWAVCAGFIPFRVNRLHKDVEDDLNYLGVARSEYYENTSKVLLDLSSFERSDFEFTVPHVGFGEYEIYTDEKDLQKKMRRVMPKNQKRSNKSFGLGHAPDVNLDGAGFNCDSETYNNKEGGDDEREYYWYVYVINTPDEEGIPSCPLTRIHYEYQFYNELKNLDLHGARLGYQPTSIIDHQFDSTHMRSADQHTSYMSDTQFLSSQKNAQRGVPYGTMDAVAKVRTHYRSKLIESGIDPDSDNVNEGMKQSSHVVEHMLPPQKKHAGFAKPTRVLGRDESQLNYIRTISVEFGIPLQDLGIMNTKYKLDREQQVPGLTDQVRTYRNTVRNFLYSVFHKKNEEHLDNVISRLMETMDERRHDMQEIILSLNNMANEIRSDLEEAVKRTAEDPIKNSSDAKKSDEPKEEKEDDKKEGSKDTEDKIESSKSTEKPFETSQSIDAWLDDVKSHYRSVTRVYEFLYYLTQSHNPVTIHWRQPIVIDASSINTITEMLNYSDEQRNRVTRTYLGMD